MFKDMKIMNFRSVGEKEAAMVRSTM